jgi:hypothetical protein
MIALAIVLGSCTPLLAQTPDAAYRAEFQKWQQEQVKDLKDNWLPLIGLFWLKEGENTFGSAKGSAIELPASSAPARAGVVVRKGKEVAIKVADGAKVTTNGKPVREAKLVASPPGPPTVLELGSLRMFVVQRGNRFALRVKDMRNPAINEFKGLQTYPLNQAYIVTADFVAAKDKTMGLTDVLGDVRQVPVPGEVRFRLNGQELRLTPIEGENGTLFFTFSDLTRKKDTYPGGRFLGAPAPKNGKVVLDFNKAYSPPCAWTPYATCPLPPKQNQLQVEIPAGEKYAGHH